MSHMYVAYVALATFLYVVLDVYPEIKSFLALFLSISFWLLITLFTILNTVAFTLLRSGAPKLVALTGDPFSANLLLLFFSTVGVFSILSSYSLKLGDYKPVDLEAFFAKMRAALLSEASRKKADLARARTNRLAKQLAEFYTAHAQSKPTLIDQDYARLMMTGSTPEERITEEIKAATDSPRGKIFSLVNKMVAADESTARTYLP